MIQRYDTTRKLAGKYRILERRVRNKWLEHSGELLSRSTTLNPPDTEEVPTDLPKVVAQTITEEVCITIRYKELPHQLKDRSQI